MNRTTLVILLCVTCLSLGLMGKANATTLAGFPLAVNAGDELGCHWVNISKNQTIDMTYEFFDFEGNLLSSSSVSATHPGKAVFVAQTLGAPTFIYCKLSFQGNPTNIRAGMALNLDLAVNIN